MFSFTDKQTAKTKSRNEKTGFISDDTRIKK